MKVVDIARISVSEALSIAARALSQGKVIVCPTDTIYGLIADVANAKAVEKIFRIKQREKGNPLGIFVKDLAMAKKFAKITRRQEAFLKTVWPGKVTAVLQAKKQFPEGVGKQKTIGIRVPNHPFLRLLLARFKHPLVQTSVNISRAKPIERAEDMVRVFGKRKWKPYIILNAGILPPSRPSQVIDITAENRKIIRK